MQRCFDNSPSGHLELLQYLASVGPQLVVLEPTGGYELEPLCALWQSAIPVAVVNPRQIRDFDRSLGKLAKTDLLDAELIAQYAQTVRPLVRPPKSRLAVSQSGAVLARRPLTLTADKCSTVPGPQRSPAPLARMDRGTAFGAEAERRSVGLAAHPTHAQSRPSQR